MITVGEWSEDATCASTDPELFFPEKGSPGHTAKAICAACPVVAECLEYALAVEGNSLGLWNRHGIYGGLNPRERRDLVRANAVNRGRAAAA